MAQELWLSHAPPRWEIVTKCTAHWAGCVITELTWSGPKLRIGA